MGTYSLIKTTRKNNARSAHIDTQLFITTKIAREARHWTTLRKAVEDGGQPAPPAFSSESEIQSVIFT